MSAVSFCETCGEDISKQPCVRHERRTRIDIQFEKVIEHVDAEIKTCDNCHAEAKAAFPSDMQDKLQYGNDLKAYAINLIVCQMVALNRVKKCIKAMTGQTISEATLLKFVLRLHEALETREMAAIDELLNSNACHVNETSLRFDKKNHWIHVYSSDDITLKKLHRNWSAPQRMLMLNLFIR